MTKTLQLLRTLFGALALWLAPSASASSLSDEAAGRGVSLALAQHRAAQLHDVEYRLHFDISASAEQQVKGRADISFRLDAPEEVVLDFYPSPNEHIVVPAAEVQAGRNTLHYEFEVDPQLVNHRGNLVYTLSVPDKARRLFPCFDQPDIKAIYHLTLSLPEDWTAVSNGAVTDNRTEEGRTTVTFAPTEPLSTYLFAFAAAPFARRTMTKDGRSISLYHLETDPARTAQCDEILREVFASLEWLEAYTGIPYPFAKYDLVIIPGFQFGGMEHTGATLYNDRLLFLPPQTTLDERLARTSLIAHETAHMWFGDYVTMKWFGEVWTKEVFANYYAACMAAPLYPDVDHRLRFMLAYAPLAYDEDRTLGANPIQQKLANLQDAGLVYGNIIYDKSPMMMRQLVVKVGEETFRKGIQQYLRRNAYGNATWDGLIAELDSLSPENLTAWSSQWVHEAGMPVYRLSRKGRQLTVHREGENCPQRITFRVGKDTVSADCSGRVTRLRLPGGDGVLLPNADGMAYGYFAMSDEMLRASAEALGEVDDLVRGAQLINLHEALWRGDITAADYIPWLTAHLPREKNPLLYSMMVGHLRTAHTRYAEGPDEALEQTLLGILRDDSVAARKVIALRALADVMDTPETVALMRRLWQGELPIEGFELSDLDAMRLTYQLAVRLPEEADSLVAQERRRLQRESLQKEFDFVAPAVSPRAEDRDALFALLLQPEGRKVEPWAETALAYLNHRYRRSEAMKYILPGLEAVEDVKRTGDIFFPKRWVASLLGGHRTDEARRLVMDYLKTRPDYPPMLRNKILMNIY